MAAKAIATGAKKRIFETLNVANRKDKLGSGLGKLECTVEPFIQS